MSKFSVVSKQVHASLRWQRYTDYRFAATDAVVPLVLQEMPEASREVPLAFVARGYAFVPVAVQGVEPQKNLFVAPDGRWVGSYTPANYRAHPFQLVRTADEQLVLAVDEDSGLVTDGAEGEFFFQEDGTPAPVLKEVFDFLSTLQMNREATARVCAALQAQQLIQPWPIAVELPEGRRQVEGLYRIDEAAFNRLPAEVLVALRDLGALPVVYCQLLSMQNLSNLALLARSRLAQAAVASVYPEASLDFINEGGTINFGKIF